VVTVNEQRHPSANDQEYRLSFGEALPIGVSSLDALGLQIDIEVRPLLEVGDCGIIFPLCGSSGFLSVVLKG